MSNVPTHIGIIMDGNRRWAKQHNLSTNKGHEEGVKTLRRIALQAIKKDVKYLSVYAFSTENWQRTSDEVGYLMRLVVEAFKRHLKEFDELGARLVMIGSQTGVDKKVLKTIMTAFPPYRMMNRPSTKDIRSHARDMGSMTKPEMVGRHPSTFCR